MSSSVCLVSLLECTRLTDSLKYSNSFNGNNPILFIYICVCFLSTRVLHRKSDLNHAFYRMRSHDFYISLITYHTIEDQVVRYKNHILPISSQNA